MPSYVLKRSLGRTNCLTYVPKNVNLELINGRVVIKAGSKIYVPNGFESDGKTRKFDEVVLTSNITSDNGAYSGLYCYNTAGWFSVLTNTVSGSSLANPASLQGWYDTTNNIIKRYHNQQGWQTGFSFPICRVTSNGTNITSIDQIFQWCGNFGQTQFFLPGIKGLKSNGFNANGTYKNIEVETKSVILNQYTYQATNQQVFIANNGTSFYRTDKYYSQETAPALTAYSVWHNTKDNFNYYIESDTSTGWVKGVFIDFPAIPSISTNSSYQVTSLTPATVRTTPTIKDCVLKRCRIVPIEYKAWTQPVLTSDTSSSKISLSSSSTYNSAFAMFKAFDGNDSTGWLSADGTGKGSLYTTFPNKLRISSISVKGWSNPNGATKSITIYKDKGNTQIVGATHTYNGNGTYTWTFGTPVETNFLSFYAIGTGNLGCIGEIKINAQEIIPEHREDTNYVLRRK